MIDLSIIFLTVNRVPKKWAEYHKKVLLEATRDYPIISVSRKPVDMPGINLIQREPISASNIYKQMLRAAKIAKTPYVAIAEDDSLYPLEHFIYFRPKANEFAYNMCRWAVFTWGTPTYFWRNRISNLTLIAPRELLIKALEVRFAKYPNGTPDDRTGELGKDKTERLLRLPVNNMVQFFTTTPIVNFNHIKALDPREQNMRKRMAPLRAFDIPYWGKADKLVTNFK